MSLKPNFLPNTYGGFKIIAPSLTAGVGQSPTVSTAARGNGDSIASGTGSLATGLREAAIPYGERFLDAYVPAISTGAMKVSYVPLQGTGLITPAPTLTGKGALSASIVKGTYPTIIAANVSPIICHISIGVPDSNMAAEVDSLVVGFAVAGAGITAIKEKTDYLPSATAGATGGVAIVGSNMHLIGSYAFLGTDGKMLISTDNQDVSTTLHVDAKTLNGAVPANAPALVQRSEPPTASTIAGAVLDEAAGAHSGLITTLVRSATPANTLAVDSSHRAASDVAAFVGTTLTESRGSSISAAFKKLFDVELPVMTVESVNQTGDAYSSLTSGVTLAASQGSYAPAKAGDKMDIVDAPSATGVGVIVTAVWSALTSALTVPSSVGKWLVNLNNATQLTQRSEPPAASTIAGAVLDEAVGSHTGLITTLVRSTTPANTLTVDSSHRALSDVASILGSAITGTASYLSGAVSKFFNIQTPTGTVNSLPDAVAGATGGVAVVGSLMKVSGTKQTLDDLHDAPALVQRSEPPAASAIRTELETAGGSVALIKAKTDNLPDHPAAVGSAMDIVNVPNSTAVTAIQSGLATSLSQTTVLNAVNAITTNTARSAPRVPTWFEIPAAGSSTYVADLYLYALEGDLEDADTQTVTVHARNAAGTSFDSHLLSTTMARISAGRYRFTYTVSSADSSEPIYFDFTWFVGAVPMADGGVVSVSTVDMSAALVALQEAVDNIPTNPLITTDARLPVAGVVAVAGDKMNLVDVPNATALTAVRTEMEKSGTQLKALYDLRPASAPPTKTELDTAFTEVKGASWSNQTLKSIGDKTTNLPASPAAVGSAMVISGTKQTLDALNDAPALVQRSEPPTASAVAGAVLDEAVGTHTGLITTLVRSTTPANTLSVDSSHRASSDLASILGSAITGTASYLSGAISKFFGVQTPTGTVNSLPDAVAGASGGLAIVGSEMVLTDSYDPAKEIVLGADHKVLISSDAQDLSTTLHVDGGAGEAPTVEAIRTELEGAGHSIALIKAKTDNLPSSPAAVGSLMKISGTKQTLDDLHDAPALVQRSEPPTVEAIRTELEGVGTKLTAVKSKTDNLPASPAAVGSAMIISGTKQTLDALHDAPALIQRSEPPTAEAIRTELEGTGHSLALVKERTDNLPDDPASESTLSTLSGVVGLKASQASVDALAEVVDAVDALVVGIKASTDALPTDPASSDGVAGVLAEVENVLEVLQGLGPDSVTISLVSGGTPLANAWVWVSSDAAGRNVVSGAIPTDSAGSVRFWLHAGNTYYLWAQKDGIKAIQGQSFVASVDSDTPGPSVVGISAYVRSLGSLTGYLNVEEGTDPVTVWIQSGGDSVADAEVWVTLDARGRYVVAGPDFTGTEGTATFTLTSGATYYLWATKNGQTLVNGSSFIAQEDV